MDTLPKQLVDTLYDGAGNHPGYRVNHARGVLLAGNFVASAQARALTTAAHMQGAKVPILLRFSNFSGQPDIADNDPHANPRGIAIRFALPDGSHTDLVGHSAKGFPAKTPEEFLEFLKAANQAPTLPEVLQHYLDTHAVAQRFITNLPPTPHSYAGQSYYTLHTLVFTAADGKRTVGRIEVEPEVASNPLSDAEAAKQPADFLAREITNRVAHGAVRMRLVLQVAQAGDATDDISTPWPDDRKKITLGTLTLERVITDPQAQAKILFDPAQLPPGIVAAGDPMLAARSAAYHLSFARRNAPPHDAPPLQSAKP